MNTRARNLSALDLMQEALQWRLLSLLHSRPTAERKSEARRLARECGAADLRAAVDAWFDNASEGAYLHLLGPGGLVPAREVAYRPFADPGGLLGEIAHCHRAFGYPDAAEEPPDHIAMLADFVAYLLLKEAYARETGAEDAAAITRAAIEHFVAEHVAAVAGGIAGRLAACGATEWSAAARLLAAKAPPPPSADIPRWAEDPFDCGGCEGVTPARD